MTKNEKILKLTEDWLYEKLNNGEIDVDKKSIESLISEYQERLESTFHPVPSKTSSPILERLMQHATPESIQSAKRRMAQDAIDNMVDEHRDELSRMCLSDSTVNHNLIGYSQGLNDMFHFLEDLIEPETLQDNGHR